MNSRENTIREKHVGTDAFIFIYQKIYMILQARANNKFDDVTYISGLGDAER